MNFKNSSPPPFSFEQTFHERYFHSKDPFTGNSFSVNLDTDVNNSELRALGAIQQENFVSSVTSPINFPLT